MTADAGGAIYLGQPAHRVFPTSAGNPNKMDSTSKPCWKASYGAEGSGCEPTVSDNIITRHESQTAVVAETLDRPCHF